MKNIFLLLLAFMILSLNAFACTTAVVSGKYTKDGKAILWKLRDSDFFKNKLRYFTDGNIPYIALLNSQDAQGKEVWGGFNKKGFAIMNAASFNTNLSDTSKFKDQEGIIMKLALQKCETLEDFENLLKDLPKPMGLNANFGVIDAKGGAAYYETDNYKFIKFDANDPIVAPNGYLIRTNFSYTGKKDIGYGFIRNATAIDLFERADAKADFSVSTFIKDFSRSLNHSLLKKDYSTLLPNKKRDYFINSGDFICRNGSASALIIKGVKKDESPKNTVFWSLISFPLTTVAIPVWITKDGDLPNICIAKGIENAQLSEYAMKLKERCYPIKRSSGYKYMDLAAYQNSVDGGIRKHINEIEDVILNKSTPLLDSNNSDKEISDFYDWLDNFVTKEYKNRFNL